ncbi:hypothetical protein X801_08170, partial [Opisthorchis viverrini]
SLFQLLRHRTRLNRLVKSANSSEVDKRLVSESVFAVVEIFTNLEDIKNIWLEMRFSISPYTKCNKEPCFILASVEEPSQIMEDHMMSLQSIGASRHATPFLAIVRQWERDLTIVSDTL